jgi:WD40 repeat protein
VNPHSGAITAMATMGASAVTGGQDGKIVRFNLQKGIITEVTIIGTHASRVTAVAIQDGLVVSGSIDGEIAIWDPQQNIIFVRAHDAPVSHLAFLGVRDALVSVSEDNSAAIWSFGGERLATCLGHRDRITALVIDSRSAPIYTASLDRTVRAWDFKGAQRGIVYGDHPFSAMTLIQNNVVPGDVLVGDDSGAFLALRYRDATIEPFQARFPPPPRFSRTKSSKKTAPSVRTKVFIPRKPVLMSRKPPKKK